MSGLLHRLAAHALGRTARVRSAACLPYSEPIPFAEPASDFNTLPAAAVQRENAAERDPAPRQSTIATHSPEASALDVIESKLSQITASHQSAATRPPAGRVRQATPAPLIAPGAVTERLEEEIAARPRDSHREPYSWDTESTPAEPRDEVGAQVPAHLQRGIAQTRHPAHPAPLLKPVAAEPSQARLRTPQPGVPLADRVEETTEVHVSIGRIEVTAVHEAPPPRRPAPRAANPTSLDEYLARRGTAR